MYEDNSLESCLKPAAGSLHLRLDDAGRLDVQVDNRGKMFSAPTFSAEGNQLSVSVDEKFGGRWVARLDYPVSDWINQSDCLLHIRMKMEVWKPASLVGEARWFREKPDGSYENYKTKTCIFGERKG